MQGLKLRTTSAGIPVMRLHYTADPGRQSENWIKAAEVGYPGGRLGPRWRKEQEIDYGATGGTVLFPLWEQWQQTPIIAHYFEPVGYQLYASYDHGWNNPACYLVHGVDGDGNIVTLWEFYGDHVPVSQICEIIHGQTIQTSDGRTFFGNPYAGKETMQIADPTIWAEDVPLQDGPNKSTEYLFRQNGVYFFAGERGGDITVAEWLHGYFWKDPQRPRYRIMAGCKKLIWELGKQRHREYSAQVNLTRDPQENLVDKDNHAWDALKMFLRRFPPPATFAKPPEQGNTFIWWKKQMQRQMIGLPNQTFRRDFPSKFSKSGGNI